MIETDVLILGAGAAGLMCAIEAGKRHRKVLVIDHANKPGKKILMSGGGRCNFTNLSIKSENYTSHNPHFFKSALSRYTQWDFLELVKKHAIPYHEKKHGQLFCDNKSIDILNMLLTECHAVNANISLNESVTSISQINDNHFQVISNKNTYQCQALVVATGGLSIPTLGASPFGYKIAAQFGIEIWPTRAGLVPLTLHIKDKELLGPLSGISSDSLVFSQQHSFRENILFTHRGLSGPAILQISNYWHPGNKIRINLLPDLNLAQELKLNQKIKPNQSLKECLAKFISRRIISVFLNSETENQSLQSLTHREFEQIAMQFHDWHILPNATEGYRTAEVTLGGVDCDAISSKTMECNDVKGLYFIGEVLDVSGWLGGYNFQWAWSSGWAAGQVV